MLYPIWLSISAHCGWVELCVPKDLSKFKPLLLVNVTFYKEGPSQRGYMVFL